MVYNKSQNFEFPEEQMFNVLDALKVNSEILRDFDTKDLCDQYTLLYPPKFGKFIINEDRVLDLASLIMNNTLRGMVNEGLVEMSWDNIANDFAFSLRNHTFTPSAS
jgi:hypothetical protein